MPDSIFVRVPVEKEEALRRLAEVAYDVETTLLGEVVHDFELDGRRCRVRSEIVSLRRIVHSYLGALGADHDLESAARHVAEAEAVYWVAHPLGHDLAVQLPDGHLYYYAVPRPAEKDVAPDKGPPASTSVLRNLGPGPGRDHLDAL
jgi:hypothetical protein